MRLIILILSFCALSNCGTMISGTDQHIKINAYDPLGKPVPSAKCYVRDANKKTHAVTYEQHTIHVQRSRHPIEIACLDNKFRTQTYNVHSYNNTDIYNNLYYKLSFPTKTLAYHLYADKTPDYIVNDINKTQTDSPDFIWDYRLGIDYVDYISGAFWEYPRHINMQFSSFKTITNYEYSHKPIPIPKGINYINMIE